MSVGRALYRSLLHRVGRGRLRELLDEVPFRIPATALPLCGEEAFVRAGQPIPTLRYDPHGPPVSLGPPPVATRADLLRLVQVSFKTEVRDGEDAERMEGAFEGLRRLTALQSQLEGLVQTREKRDGDREQVRYSIGEVFRHKNFGYRGVVVGWDGHCNRPKEWLTGNGMSAARGQQPFYHIIPDQADCVRLFGSTRESKYVAQDNLEPIDDVEERAIDHEHLMAFFSRYSPATGAFVPCEELAYIYPDEYPVVEEEEDTASFIVAAQRGDLVQLQEKLDKGVDVDAMDQWGNGALHWAAHHGHHQCAATLLEYGADPDLVHGNFGITPLHCAKNVSVLNLLLGHGANPYAIDQEGYSVSDWAAAANRDEVVVVLTALQDSATGRADPRRPPANLVEFCSTLVEPVEKYAHTAQARGKYYGRFGSALIHIMVFHSSAWDQSSGADSAYEDVLTAMTEAHSEYRPATFLNVLVDMADPSNADIVKQFGMSNAKIPTIRALSFERSDSTSTDSTRRGVATLCGQSIPDFDFDFGEPTSYVRFATQLEEIALAPTVTVRPDVNMDGQGRELTRLGGSGKQDTPPQPPPICAVLQSSGFRATNLNLWVRTWSFTLKCFANTMQDGQKMCPVVKSGLQRCRRLSH